MNLYRGTVARAMRGKRGQSMLRELALALDAMPVKRLASRSFQTAKGGDVCTLGCLLRVRGVDTTELDAAIGDPCDDYPEDVSEAAGSALGVARSMAAEIMFENDDPFCHRVVNETPEERWARMRFWVDSQILEAT